jgi:aminopeptidase N
MMDQVSEILSFYGGLLDDFPYPTLALTLVDSDLPGGHSPAYFALLYEPLPTTPYSWRNDPVYFSNFPQFFVAHELAHQFWGQAVGWKSYHEQWISEGFSQYFAALYAERRGAGNVFRDVLRRMARSVWENEDQGPITLGYRLGHIRGDSRIFRAVVYNKSALVLHMLRRLVGDGPFFEATRRLYRSSRFTKIGTDDVQKVFEEVTGRSFGAFFQRWFYESNLPRIKWSWRLEAATAPGIAVDEPRRGRQASAGWLQVHFDQGCPPEQAFVLPVTVTVSFADGSARDVPVEIHDAIADARIPLDKAVRSVDVNADGSALARFDRQ